MSLRTRYLNLADHDPNLAAARLAGDLMRGDSQTFKAGYAQPDAELSACEVFPEASEEAVHEQLERSKRDTAVVLTPVVTVEVVDGKPTELSIDWADSYQGDNQNLVGEGGSPLREPTEEEVAAIYQAVWALPNPTELGDQPMTTTMSGSFVLLIDNEGDYGDPDCHGPFDSIPEGQAYARALRERWEIPGHENDVPTAEENEAWSAEGWHFAIYEMRKEI